MQIPYIRLMKLTGGFIYNNVIVDMSWAYTVSSESFKQDSVTFHIPVCAKTSDLSVGEPYRCEYYYPIGFMDGTVATDPIITYGRIKKLSDSCIVFEPDDIVEVIDSSVM